MRRSAFRVALCLLGLWILGFRVHWIPGIQGTVMIAGTDQPVPRAVMFFNSNWQWGFGAKPFVNTGTSYVVDWKGVDRYECMTDQGGRFRLWGRLVPSLVWWKDFSGKYDFYYLSHPLYAAASVTHSNSRDLVVSVVLLSEYARRLAAGETTLQQRLPGRDAVSQVKHFMNGEYFFQGVATDPSASEPAVPRTDAYRDYARIREEWIRTARILKIDPESVLASLRAVEVRGQ